MKNKSNRLLISTFCGGLIFNYIFWNQRLALNLLIYSLLIITSYALNKDILKGRKFKVYAIAHIFAALLVVINNSDLTLVAYYISLILFIGYSNYQQIRTVFVAAIAFFIQMVTVPFNLIKNLSQAQVGNFNLKPVLTIVKFVILPTFMLTVFTIIYSAASPVFEKAVSAFITHISDFFYTILHFFFQDLTIERFFFFCFGFMVTGGLIIGFASNHLEQAELRCREQLVRIRSQFKKNSLWFEFAQLFTGNLFFRKMALKTEFITAIISFASLNLLLLALNSIDITTLWFGYRPSGNFSADLHDGTSALIFSIILAMAVIICFFRGNLNFYSKSKTLRYLAYVWIAQNFILILSVFIRDGYYIGFHGLTHKRIGVIVFAVLCIVGLFTVYVKVSKQKSFFYLLKLNGSIWFILLLLSSTVNWDVFILKYNLSNIERTTFDVDYALSLSDKTLPTLAKNRARLAGPHLKNAESSVYQNQLDTRVDYFKERYQKVSWLSWNLQDWNTAGYFSIRN